MGQIGALGILISHNISSHPVLKLWITFGFFTILESFRFFFNLNMTLHFSFIHQQHPPPQFSLLIRHREASIAEHTHTHTLNTLKPRADYLVFT